MNKPLLISLLIVLLLGFPFSLLAQTFQAKSEPFELDFGFPELRVSESITFIDENENNLIDQNEGCIITFEIFNDGLYPAREVILRPQELNQVAGISFPEEVLLGQIQPGGKKRFQLGIEAGEVPIDETANFVFYLFEYGEPIDVSIVYAVGTRLPKATPDPNN